MVTGHRARTARAIASKLGIQRVLAEVRPADKARKPGVCPRCNMTLEPAHRLTSP